MAPGGHDIEHVLVQKVAHIAGFRSGGVAVDHRGARTDPIAEDQRLCGIGQYINVDALLVGFAYGVACFNSMTATPLAGVGLDSVTRCAFG